MDENNNIQPSFTPPTVSSVSTPAEPAPVNNTVQPINMIKPSNKRNKLLLMIALPLVVLLLLAAGYFFAYLPNQPSYIWKSSLKNTSKLYSVALGEYEKDKEILGADINGKFKSTGSFASDGTIDGSFDPKGNGVVKVDVGAVGVRINAEFRSIVADDQNTPDLYFNVSGFKGLGAAYGFAGLDKFDGQWISADHTLLDQAISSTGASTTDQLTPDDMVALLKVVGEVNDEYLWNDDNSKSVFEIKEKLGNEKVDDREAYHFKVGINRENLKTYLKQLGERARAVEGSASLEDFTKQIFSETSINSMIEDIDKRVDENSTVDAWVDKSTKTFRRVRITNKEDSSSYFDFGMRYEGGDELPFYFAGVSKDSKGEFSISVNIKQKSANLSANIESGGSNFEGSLGLKNRTEAVKVEKPASSTPILEVYSEILGGGFGTSDF